MLLYKTSWSVQVNSPIVENPSCLQTTVASILSQFTSHTVPHTPFKQISTLPSNSVWPPLNRTAPSVHATNRGELIFIVKLELGWLKNRVAVHHIKIKVHLRIIVTLGSNCYNDLRLIVAVIRNYIKIKVRTYSAQNNSKRYFEQCVSKHCKSNCWHLTTGENESSFQMTTFISWALTYFLWKPTNWDDLTHPLTV